MELKIIIELIQKYKTKYGGWKHLAIDKVLTELEEDIIRIFKKGEK